MSVVRVVEDRRPVLSVTKV